MLHTVEAIYDPKQGLVFSEAVQISHPVKVLVTFMATEHPPETAEKGSFHALSAVLKAYPLPESERPSDTEIDAQIREISSNWE